jgi:hypothetical protein
MTSILYDNEEQDRLLERIGHAINANNGRCSLAEEVLSECSTLVTAIMENRKAWGLDKPAEAAQDWPDGSSHLVPRLGRQLGRHEDGSFTMHPEAWKAFCTLMRWRGHLQSTGISVGNRFEEIESAMKDHHNVEFEQYT